MSVSVLVMDSSFQTKRPWRDINASDFSPSDQRALESRQIPGISSALDHSLPISAEHRLAPIATSFESRPNQPPDSVVVSAGPDGIRSSRPASPSAQSPHWRPEKRPRWRYSQDSTTAPSVSTDLQIYAHQSEKDFDSCSAGFGKPDDATFASPHQTSCRRCAHTHDLIESLVSGLINLDTDIRKILDLSPKIHSNTSIELTKFGLRQSLQWASDNIQESARLVRLTTRRSGGPLAVAIHADQDQGPQISHFNATSLATYEKTFRRRATLYENERLDERGQYRAPSLPPDKAPGLSTDTSTSLLYSTDQMKRTYHVEPPPLRQGQSPHDSPPTSIRGSGQSPSQSQPSNRTLPSPSAYQYPPSASSLPSSHGYSDSQITTTAQTAHLQDLQHQISTKTLALQTLQREHDQLLAAFSRSQIRCTTLDKKSQVSDHEINTLAEEKVRLQRQVEALEVQVEELARAKNEAQQRSEADQAQWQRIMSMSSRLQMQGAEEARQHRSEKEGWERDREGLEQRVRELETGKLMVVRGAQPSDIADSIDSDDVLSSSSLDTLREEILRLRQKCSEMETILQGIKGETENLSPALATLANVRDRISAKTQLGLPEEQRVAEHETKERS